MIEDFAKRIVGVGPSIVFEELAFFDFIRAILDCRVCRHKSESTNQQHCSGIVLLLDLCDLIAEPKHELANSKSRFVNVSSSLLEKCLQCSEVQLK